MDGATWDLITRLDLRAPYFLSQRAARRMIEQGDGGSIVSISSVNAQYGLEQVSVYGPAKAALSQLMRVMALEWAPHGIRANAIAPGFMDTPLAAPVWADPDVHRWILNRVPAERPGRRRESSSPACSPQTPGQCKRSAATPLRNRSRCARGSVTSPKPSSWIRR